MKAQIEVPEGSVIKNLTVPSGTVFPLLANDGELFFLTTGTKNLYVYRTDQWVALIKANLIIEFINASVTPTLSLPSASLFTDVPYRIKRVDTNSNLTVTISGANGESIDGDSSITLYPLESLTLIGYSGQWYVI